MFCAHCGASDQVAESYCRKCGEWLTAPGSRSTSKPDDKMTSMVVFNAMSAVFALTSAIVLYATYLGTDEAKWSMYMAAALCLAITVHQSISFWYALDVKLRHRRGRKGVSAAPTDRLPKQIEPPPPAHAFAFRDMPSVTEHTTDRLKVPANAEQGRDMT